MKTYEMCWLEYDKLSEDKKRYYTDWVRVIWTPEELTSVRTSIEELRYFINASFGLEPEISKTENSYKKYVLIGTLGKIVDFIEEAREWENLLGEEGFIIKNIKDEAKDFILVTGKTSTSLLYGVFELIKLIRLGERVEGLDLISNPKARFRMINHWDNLDGSIERGYAGNSIFFKDYQILHTERIKDYARLLSSIGINGIVLNNVNVRKKAIELIEAYYLKELAKIADVFRDYGIRLFIGINFASPIYLGRLETADPLDKRVRSWWKKKVEEIYSFIPDLGGFIVKADSEFTPGPHMYGRNHADGANMLAEALTPFSGYVIWRAFVYNCMQDWRDTATDRAKAGYDNFKPLDGLFNDNVIIQIKNGPMDFQVREPVSPLFGGLEKTNQIIELQITQEYTGQQIHLCYLGTFWKEVLEFDTYVKGKGSTVKRIVDGSLFGRKNNGFAGISNIGDASNWTGHDLAQANLWTFGRLAWNPDESIEDIVNEWIRLTFGDDEKVIENITYMLLKSHRIYEKYTTPLGLGWMVNPGHHYGPNPEGYEYSHWGTYHRADLRAIGVDRTSRGTGYSRQYHPYWQEIFDDIDRCPEDLLLFFHRIPYTYRLKSGKTLIQYIYDSHFEGVEEAEILREKWLELKGKIEDKRFNRVLERLNLQVEHAKEWRDVINTYFYRKTGIPDEKGRKIYP